MEEELDLPLVSKVEASPEAEEDEGLAGAERTVKSPLGEGILVKVVVAMVEAVVVVVEVLNVVVVSNGGRMEGVRLVGAEGEGASCADAESCRILWYFCREKGARVPSGIVATGDVLADGTGEVGWEFPEESLAAPPTTALAIVGEVSSSVPDETEASPEAAMENADAEEEAEDEDEREDSSGVKLFIFG